VPILRLGLLNIPRGSLMMVSPAGRVLIVAMRLKEETYVVDFDGPDDPLSPLNWSIRKRVMTTVLLSLTTFVVTFASSVFSSALRVVAIEFNISDEVATLGTSLFVVGFAIGPIVPPSRSLLI
jgi:hypothetical protein